jgi:hypothetical protein
MSLKSLNAGAGEAARQKVETFIAGGSITAGDWVGFDVSQSDSDRAAYVVQGSADALTFGVALETATSGAKIRVVVKGYVEGALTDAGVSSGEALTSHASGACDTYANTDTTPVIGVALETDSGTTCDVYVFGLCH